MSHIKPTAAEDIFSSMLAPGTGPRTILALNVTLGCLIASLIGTLAVGFTSIHVYIMLGLAVCLLCIINLFMSQIMENGEDTQTENTAESSSFSSDSISAQKEIPIVRNEREEESQTGVNNNEGYINNTINQQPTSTNVKRKKVSSRKVE